MAIEHIDPALCIGCGACAESCIMDVIRINEENGKATIAYGNDCMSCLCCEQDCPTGAITVSIFEKPRLRTWG